MASPESRPTWTPPTAHDELRNRVATIDRDIQRYTEDIAHLERQTATHRETVAFLEGLKVDYENVLMLAFSKADG